jgi:hypothetical protein
MGLEIEQWTWLTWCDGFTNSQLTRKIIRSTFFSECVVSERVQCGCVVVTKCCVNPEPLIFAEWQSEWEAVQQSEWEAVQQSLHVQ